MSRFRNRNSNRLLVSLAVAALLTVAAGSANADSSANQPLQPVTSTEVQQERIDLFALETPTASVVRKGFAPAVPAWSPLNQGVMPSTDPDGITSKQLMELQPVDAFWRSAILPGWGQRYMGRNTRGTLYTAIDAVLWTGLIWSQQGWKMGENNYKAFADQHASITSGQNHDFYVDIGNYDNRDEFNTARRQQRDYSGQYNGSSTWWEWDASDNRLMFKDLRINADRHKNRVYYLAGGLLLNRIISAIDAGRGLSMLKKNAKTNSGISVGINPVVGGPTVVWRGTLGR